MSLLRKTKLICKQYNIHPSKSKGQNFLINERIYQKIIDAANLSLFENGTILEVGPGLGFLTKQLCRKVKKVIAIELDKNIFNYLQVIKKLEKLNNLEIINQNILNFPKSRAVNATDADLNNLPHRKNITVGDHDSTFKIDKPCKIISNLPYNITSIFLRKFLTAKNGPIEMVLTLQKEVAKRIAAKRGQMSLLAISVQFYSGVEIIEYIDKTNFWPKPKVDSAIVRIKPKTKNQKPKINEQTFFRIVKIGFSAKRKKLINNLANGLRKKPTEISRILEKNGLVANARAQELKLEDWIRLSNTITIDKIKN